MSFKIKKGVLVKNWEEDGVTEVTIPDGVISIGDWVFAFCLSLKSITIPNSVTSIGDDAFSCCEHLTSITIPNSVTSIGDRALSYCKSLTGITIPDSVTSIGDMAFWGCTSLKSIDVSNKHQNFCSCNGILYNKDMTLIIKYPEAKKKTEFIIPNSVTSISNGAFWGCESLESITIPNSVTSIGDSAFGHCVSLKNITIPNSVTSIGNSAFEDCTSITSITIPDSVESIGKGAFNSCTNLTSITIPDSITSIGECAFHIDTKIIICKGDVKVPFILKDNWNEKKPERLLNDFIVADVNNRQQYFEELKPYYKIPPALFMSFAYPQKSSNYLNYLKKNTKKAVTFMIDEEYIELLYRFLELGFITKKNIDSFISYAVEHTQNGGSAEPQLILSKYKSDNFSSKGADALDKLIL